VDWNAPRRSTANENLKCIVNGGRYKVMNGKDRAKVMRVVSYRVM
jgi:hypothetical protein